MSATKEVKLVAQQVTLPYATALLVGFSAKVKKSFLHDIPEHCVVSVNSIAKAKGKMKSPLKPIIVVLNYINFGPDIVEKFFVKTRWLGIEVLVASSRGNGTAENGTHRSFIGIRDAIKKTKEKIRKHTPTL